MDDRGRPPAAEVDDGGKEAADKLVREPPPFVGFAAEIVGEVAVEFDCETFSGAGEGVEGVGFSEGAWDEK